VVSDALVVWLASGPLHLAAIGHGAYARPDIIGATVNTAFRVNGWAAANAKGRIGAAFPTDCDVSGAFQVMQHGGVVLKGMASALDIVEITGRL
jgi:class 3 adenylate cyclase